MRFKGTLALLLVFAGLGAYVYFVEYRGADEREKQEAAKKKVFAIEGSNVAGLTLEFPDRTVSAVRKGEEQWEFTNPAGLEADAAEWESLATNLAGVQREESIVAEKADPAQYGLDKPFVKVTAKLQNGETIGVTFGSENPRKTFRYAMQAGKDEVFLSPTSSSSGFDKSLFDLRNKRLLDFQSDTVTAVRIAVAGRPEIELEKAGEDWMLRKPVEARADNNEVSSFVSSIQFARATGFAEPAVEVKQAGLEPAVIRVTLRDTAGKDHTVVFGKSSGEDKLYARDMARPAILIVGPEIPDKVRRPVFDWRDKTIARFERDTIDEIELIHGAEKIVLKKVDSQWQADGKAVRQDRVLDMLTGLEFDRATDIVDAPKALSGYGLEPARVRAALRAGGQEVLGVSFGAEVRGAEGVYARVSGGAGVLTVPKSLADRFNVRMPDLAEAPPAAPDTPPK
jgi:hypothetical protein